jgi:hypothetical protein
MELNGDLCHIDSAVMEEISEEEGIFPLIPSSTNVEAQFSG